MSLEPLRLVQSDSSLIARKLTRMSLVASGTALAIACVVLMTYDFLAFRTASALNAMTQAQIIGANSVTALVFDDPATAARTLAALAASPQIEGAGLYRVDGRPFASYRRTPDGPPLVLPVVLRDAPPWQSFDGLRIHVVSPVVLDGTQTGIVYLRASIGDVVGRLQRYVLVAAGLLLVCLAAALFVSSALRRSISAPIVELAGVATRVSSKQDYSIRAALVEPGEVGALVTAFNEMLAQIETRDRKLQESRDLLEQRVQQRTADLETSNKELEAFCYSVSHDLRAPLRSIDGFSLALFEDYGHQLNGDARGYLTRIRASTQRMGLLIDDLLTLSRITRTEIKPQTVDLSQVARAVWSDLTTLQPERSVTITIQDGLVASGDPRLLRQVFENLLGNAWKFTSKVSEARIQFGLRADNGGHAYFVQDNGAGFDEAYAARLFGVFQRLHSMAEFPGTGVGLAIVERVVHRHGGRVWATAAVGRGATFFFTLGPTMDGATHS